MVFGHPKNEAAEDALEGRPASAFIFPLFVTASTSPRQMSDMYLVCFKSKHDCLMRVYCCDMARVYGRACDVFQLACFVFTLIQKYDRHVTSVYIDRKV